jgi:hypothetical protein
MTLLFLFFVIGFGALNWICWPGDILNFRVFSHDDDDTVDMRFLICILLAALIAFASAGIESNIFLKILN